MLTISFHRSLVTFSLICLVFVPFMASATSVNELRQELEQKRKTLQNTQQKIENLRGDIDEKQKEARTLAQQISIMEDNIKSLELSIQATREEVEKVTLEVEEVQREIDETEQEVEKQKTTLAEFIRRMHNFDQQSSLTIIFTYSTFSEALNEASALKELQNRVRDTLVTIKQLRDDLTKKGQELEDFLQSLTTLQERQEQQQRTLTNQRDSRQRLLDLTNAQEEQYKSLLQQAQQTHRSSESEIKRIDDKIREELRRQGRGSLPSVGTLAWPVNPIFGVSCEFQCGGYPYQGLIGSHTGMDIPTYVGTPIKAPADGYVAKAHDSGGPGYSYILLLHGDNVSTVYGHISGFAVNEGQMVSKGTVIGYTGGAPGSRGAGLSTGPHLHFEVRINNTPVNPRRYL